VDMNSPSSDLVRVRLTLSNKQALDFSPCSAAGNAGETQRHSSDNLVLSQVVLVTLHDEYNVLPRIQYADSDLTLICVDRATSWTDSAEMCWAEHFGLINDEWLHVDAGRWDGEVDSTVPDLGS
jgi:hypothetical protein